MNRKHFTVVLVSLLLLISSPVFAQDDGSMDLGFNISIGTETFLTDGADPITYNMISFQPELAIGNFGVGLDLVFHYRFDAGPANNQFDWRSEDYWAADADDRLSTIMSRITYVRYGEKGDDLYAKLGGFEDGRLGNGFILSGYTNMLFAPDIVMTGLALDIDGGLFDFPFIGLETFSNDIFNFDTLGGDVVGGRLYIRPLAFFDMGIFEELQIGGTIVLDRDPYRFDSAMDPTPNAYDETAMVWGVDFRQPIIDNALISNVIFGDLVFENESMGAMVGTAGDLLSFIDYGAQIRYLGDGFIPTYFDGLYDVDRAVKYEVMESGASGAAFTFGYFAYAGFNFIEKDDEYLINMSVLLDGPFGVRDAGAVAPEDFINYPHLTGVFEIKQGIIPNTSIEAYYDKRYIRDFASLIDLEGALMGAKVNLYSGPVITSISTSVRYLPDTNDFEITTGLETTIQF